jgi:hypothetical protein
MGGKGTPITNELHVSGECGAYLLRGRGRGRVSGSDPPHKGVPHEPDPASDLVDPGLPLSQLLRQPLGLEVWEVKPDHRVLRTAEPQAERLRRLGDRVDQVRHSEF